MQVTNEIEKTNYYARVNVQFLWLLWAHLPLAFLTAYLCGQSLAVAGIASAAVLLAPTLLTLKDRAAIETSIANGVALVCFSAVLIQASGGMTELHFHIFASLGVIIMLAEPMAVVAAILAVVVHHVGFFFFLPGSLINYKAGFGILVIHALFALSIGIPAFFISRKFKTYIVGVADIILEISEIATGLTQTSASMLGSSKILSSSTQSEASAVQETASSMEELRAMIGRNSEGADSTAKTSSDSKAKSDSALQVMSDVVVSLTEIRTNNKEIVEAVAKSNHEMNQIVQLIQEIGSKTKVINDIVFQTKLLSFNASVEAARAGEHGKGFSVVAEEVGNLAEMSGKSAKEITALLDVSVKNVQAIITETKESINLIVSTGQKKIESGLEVAGRCKILLSEIDTNLTTVTHSADAIAEASREQSAGVNAIARAMENIEKAAQESSQVSSTSADLAAVLSGRSDSLGHAVERLVVAIETGTYSRKKAA